MVVCTEISQLDEILNEGLGKNGPIHGRLVKQDYSYGALMMLDVKGAIIQ